MVDKDRIIKSKTDISSAFNQIENLVKTGKGEYLADSKSPLALKYLLIEAVEAITDLCQHLLAKTKGVPCEGYVDCILKAGREGIITPALTNKLRRLADLRNSLIHRYWIIKDEQLYDLTVENRGDLMEFVDQIDAFLNRVSGHE